LRKGIGSPAKGAAGLIFSDADAAALSKAAVDKMDSNTLGTQDPYTVRLNKVFGNILLRWVYSKLQSIS
jgi:putative metalloprotease